MPSLSFSGISVLMMTCEEYIEIAMGALKLLRKQWPEAPLPKVVLRGEGQQWTDALADGLEPEADLTLLILDDYYLTAKPDEELIAAAVAAMRTNPTITHVDLSGYRDASKDPPYDDSGRLTIMPVQKWIVTTQIGIWRTALLKQLLQQLGPIDIWGFEVVGSDIVVKGQYNGVFLSTVTRATQYHNLIGYGRLRPNHGFEELLAAEDIKITRWPVPRN